MDEHSLLSPGEQAPPPGVSTVFTLSSPEHRFEALRMRFEDQARVLATMTDLDLRILGGYISIQLALGGWLGQHPTKVWAGIGIAIIDLAMAAIAGVMLRYNAVYRSEVVTNIKNAMDALEFTRPGAYLPDRPLNSMGPTRRWAPLYYVGILAGYIGLLFVIFSRR